MHGVPTVPRERSHRVLSCLPPSLPLAGCQVNGRRHLVDVYITAGPTSGAAPPVFFLLLSAGLFRRRTRATIYTHARCGLPWVQPDRPGRSQPARLAHRCGCLRMLDACACVAAVLLPPLAALHCHPASHVCSEEEELAFFSVFNQAVAHVAESLGVASLQVGADLGGCATSGGAVSKTRSCFLSGVANRPAYPMLNQPLP